MTCTVELGPSVAESELSLLMVDAQMFRDGTMLNITCQSVSGTTHIYRVDVSFSMKTMLETTPAVLLFDRGPPPTSLEWVSWSLCLLK